MKHPKVISEDSQELFFDEQGNLINQNKMVEKIMNKIDEDFYKENNYYLSITDPKSFAEKVAIEFAKMHIEKIMNLQQSKYYAGETGYITKEEWQDLLNVK